MSKELISEITSEIIAQEASAYAYLAGTPSYIAGRSKSITELEKLNKKIEDLESRLAFRPYRIALETIAEKDIKINAMSEYIKELEKNVKIVVLDKLQELKEKTEL